MTFLNFVNSVWGQRRTLRSLFFPCTVWVLEMMLGSECLYLLNCLTSLERVLLGCVLIKT